MPYCFLSVYQSDYMSVNSTVDVKLKNGTETKGIYGINYVVEKKAGDGLRTSCKDVFVSWGVIFVYKQNYFANSKGLKLMMLQCLSLYFMNA